MTELDLDQLEKEIQGMKYHHRLYKVLKRELLKLGHWKSKSRGDPSKGYAIMREKVRK